MAELSVEDIQEPAPQLEATAPEPEEPAEVPVEVPVGAELPEADVSAEIAAPKRRGRPAGSKNKPKAEAKRRPRQPREPREPTPEPSSEIEPPPQIDIDALLQPIFRAYMATGELRKRQARQQRYDSLFQGMVG